VALRIHQLLKRYGATVAVDRIDLEIQEGEFFTLLGPSGCGKSTTLRCAGGLEKPDGGEIYLGDRCLVDVARKIFVPPERREMGMVFQSYALWPHMTVFENVAYPLSLRGMNKDDIRRRVSEVLGLVGLGGLEQRQAPQLSGGQQQRVSLARSLAFSPRVLLLDEPLSNLDALLRDEMRRQLKDLQRRVGVTTVFVTHDQVEALSLSQRIAIMSEGRVEQIGSPREVYTQPTTPFAQSFLGKTFTLQARVTGVTNGTVTLVLPGSQNGAGRLSIPLSRTPTPEALRPDDEVLLTIRPEQVVASREAPADATNVLAAWVQSALFIGDRYEYILQLGGEELVLPLPSNQVFETDSTIHLELPAEAVLLWPR
jgi:ABC-type Fe3+/spermidine/putrescine transport system ATPase subunit